MKYNMNMIDKIIDSIIETLFDLDSDNIIYTLDTEDRRILREKIIEIFKEYDRL